MIILSTVLNFPVFCRNKKTFGGGGFFTGKVNRKGLISSIPCPATGFPTKLKPQQSS
jgi:hypothetical protein